jgi:hypothetical protein
MLRVKNVSMLCSVCFSSYQSLDHVKCSPTLNVW